MCVDHDSRPPIPEIAGAAIEHRHLELVSADGNRFAAFEAHASEPTAGRPGMLVLPDVRGLFGFYEELALRFAEVGVPALAIDYYGRSAGASRRDAGFDFASHVPRTTWAGLQADVAAAAARLRESAHVERLYSVGFCFGGRLSFLLATLPGLAMSGVVGFYGWPVGPARNDMPAPADRAAEIGAPVLGLFGGADQGIPAEDVEQYRTALESAGVEARIVSYEGAPHSFFDRKQAEFAADSAGAWAEVLSFVGIA